MRRKIITVLGFFAVVSLSALYVASCGSSGGGGGAGTGSSPAFSKGAITAKGSIFVNGVEYKTTGSTIKVEGTSGHGENELQVGMVVSVKGSMSDDGVNGEGSEVDFEDNLEGPLTAVASGTTSTLTALDQTIVADVSTHLSPTGTTINTLSTLVATTTPIIEVSGMTDSSGVIHATFIELKKSSPSASDAIELKGTIATGSTNTTAKTFRINGLTVDYGSGPAQLKDFPAGGIADGQFVEVKSTLGQYNASIHTLIAADVEYKVESSPSENDKAEIEGFVADYNSGAKTFTVSGISVNASSLTLPQGFANGSIVEVEGTYAGGIVTASKITVKTSL